MTANLTDIGAIVLGGDEVGTILARGLKNLGARVTRSVAESAGRVDLVVIPVTDPGGLNRAPLADMDEDEWIRRCEAPLNAVRVALQEAHAVLSANGGDRLGGRIVLLVPTISMLGAADFAAYSAVGEGARSLAKAAARGWGAVGITINCIALTQEQLAPGSDGEVTEKRVPPALKTPDLENDIVALIASLATGPAIVTGNTIMADGGNLMSI
jgi:NAD(P)-dependent dehydrogenase (short-subunit alcohol dehydrogenase family)